MAILIGFLLIGIFMGAIILGASITRVIKEQFEELMPQRMVDLAGFIDIRHQG